MRIRIATATTAVVAAAALAATTAPAHADSHVSRDARGDVVQLAAADDESLAEPAPGRKEGDVLRMRVTHGERAVHATIRYHRLSKPRGDDLGLHLLSLKTSKGRLADAVVVTDRRNPQGDVIWAWGDAPRTCPGLRTHIDYAADRVRLTVPRSCLGEPRWVRGGGGGSLMQGETLYGDDALLDGSLRREARLGPRVYR